MKPENRILSLVLLSLCDRDVIDFDKFNATFGGESYDEIAAEIKTLMEELND